MLRPVIVGFVACLLFSPTLAHAQRVEVWGGLTLVAADLDTPLTTKYVPVIDNYSSAAAGSTAGQTVQVQAGSTAGLGGGINLFFSPHVGVQVLLESDSRTLSGANGNYTVLLNYTARQPPDYVERPYTTSSTFTPCDATEAWGCVLPTTGSLRQTTLGFNVVGRWKAGGRVNAEVSGGLGYYDVRGNGASLRYTVYRMGGHSTLFSEQYQLAYAIGPAQRVGVNAGVAFDIEIGRNVALTSDVRYFGGGAVQAPILVDEVTNDDEIVFLQDPDEIQETLHPPDIEISPARLRVLVGLKIRL